MSNYTKVTNFAAKDSLPSGNANKVVRGSEIDTEFNNIATAVATKTDNASAAITGGTITGITDLAQLCDVWLNAWAGSFTHVVPVFLVIQTLSPEIVND